MSEEDSGKSAAGPPPKTEKSPEKSSDAEAPSDPSPPRLAPQAPTTSNATPEASRNERGESSKTTESPEEAPPTLDRAETEEEEAPPLLAPQLQQPTAPSAPPATPTAATASAASATPAVPPVPPVPGASAAQQPTTGMPQLQQFQLAKPRKGRPPGSLNKNSLTNKSVLANRPKVPDPQQQHQQRMNHQLMAQQNSMMHQGMPMYHNGMGQMQAVFAVQTPEGHIVHLPPGYNLPQHLMMQMQQGGGPNFPGRGRGQPMQQMQQQQQQQQSVRQRVQLAPPPPPQSDAEEPQQQQHRPGSPNQLVPCLVPLPNGAETSHNPITIPFGAVVTGADGNVQAIRTELAPDQLQQQSQQQRLAMHQQQMSRQLPFRIVNSPGTIQFSATQLTNLIRSRNGGPPDPNQPHPLHQMQMIQMQQMQQHRGQQRPDSLQQQQQPQLTRQNLDRISSSSGGSGGSRVSAWIGGQPIMAANGSPAGAGELLTLTPQQHHHNSLLQLQQQPPPLSASGPTDEEDEEAAPQLAAEADQILNVESLNAEEALQEGGERGMTGGRKKLMAKPLKHVVHVVDGFEITETPEACLSTHLDNDDFEPIPEDDDDTSDRSYEGGKDEKEDVVAGAARKLNRMAKNNVVDQADQWMQDRCEMDIKRAERKLKKEAEEKKHHPVTRGEAAKKKGARVGRRSNELKALLQMDFGPEENSRRRVTLPTQINPNVQAPKALRDKKDRRSASAASGSVAAVDVASTSKRGGRPLRKRESTERGKECDACGKTIEDKKNSSHPGYCSETCYRISESRSPTATEDETEETDEDVKHEAKMETVESTPEPAAATPRKKESPASSVVSSTPVGKRRSATAAAAAAAAAAEAASPSKRRRGRGGSSLVDPSPVKTEAVVKKEEEGAAAPKMGSHKKATSIVSSGMSSVDEKAIKEEVKEEERVLFPPAKMCKKEEPKKEPKEEPAAGRSKVAAGAAAPTSTPELAALLGARSSSYGQQQQQQPTRMHAKPPQQPAPAAALIAAVAPSSAPPPAAAAAAAAAAPTAASAAAEAISSEQLMRMSVADLGIWIEQITGKGELAKLFMDEDVDGATLAGLRYDDLRNDLKLSLGMSRKIKSIVDNIINGPKCE